MAIGRQVNATCAHCDKPFLADRFNIAKGMGRFCSMECAHYARGHKPPVDCTCTECGASYKVPYSRWKDGRGKQCSKGCANAAKRKPQTERPCDHCHKPLLVSPYKLVRDKVFCSRECFFSSRRTGQWVDCKYCGEAFYQKRDQAEVGKGLYCSLECYHAECNGEKHHLWTGGGDRHDKRQPHEFTGHQRKLILERDEYTCQECGCIPDEINVDHIVPIFEGGTNKLENGQTLCVPCHKTKSAAETSRRMKKATACH